MAANGIVEPVAENDPPAVEKLGGLWVSMPKSVQERMLRLAEANGRTVRAEIRCALRNHLDREGGRLEEGDAG
jgi:hypothetical protein